MKLSALVYLLVLAMVMPPPHVFAAAAGNFTQEVQTIDSLYSGMNENIEYIGRSGPACSEYYDQSACPSYYASARLKVPAQVFQDQFKDNLRMRAKLASVKEQIRVLDAPKPTVGNADSKGQKEAFDAMIAEIQKRKEAAQKVHKEIVALKADMDEAQTQLRKSGADFHESAAKCADEKWSSAGATVRATKPGGIAVFKVMGFEAARKEIPINAHRGIVLLLTKDRATCPADAVSKFESLAGAKLDGPSQMKTVAEKLKSLNEMLPALVYEFDKELTQLSASRAQVGTAGNVVAGKEGVADANRSTVSEADKKADPTKSVVKGEPSAAAAAKITKADAIADVTGEGDLKDRSKQVPTVENGPKSSVGSSGAAAALEAQEKEAWLASGKNDREGMPGFGDSTGAAKIAAEPKGNMTSFAADNPAGANVAPGTTSAKDYSVQRRGELAADAGDRRVAMPEDYTAAPRTSQADLDREVEVGTKNYEPQQAADRANAANARAESQALARSESATPASLVGAPMPTELTPARTPASQDPAPPPGTAEPAVQTTGSAPKAEPRSPQPRPADPEPQPSPAPAPVQPAPAPVAESSGFSGGMALGLLGLAAVGGGAAYLLTRKKKSSPSGLVGPMPASVMTASATATSTASDTATSTETSVATATQTSGGVVITMPTATATNTATASASATAAAIQTITATATSTSTATVVPESGINFGPRSSGGVNRGVINGTGATMYRPAPKKKKLNSTGASLFVPNAHP